MVMTPIGSGKSRTVLESDALVRAKARSLMFAALSDYPLEERAEVIRTHVGELSPEQLDTLRNAAEEVSSAVALERALRSEPPC